MPWLFVPIGVAAVAVCIAHVPRLLLCTDKSQRSPDTIMVGLLSGPLACLIPAALDDTLGGPVQATTLCVRCIRHRSFLITEPQMALHSIL